MLSRFQKNSERGDYDLQIQVDYKFEISKFPELKRVHIPLPLSKLKPFLTVEIVL